MRNGIGAVGNSGPQVAGILKNPIFTVYILYITSVHALLTKMKDFRELLLLHELQQGMQNWGKERYQKNPKSWKEGEMMANHGYTCASQTCPLKHFKYLRTVMMFPGNMRQRQRRLSGIIFSFPSPFQCHLQVLAIFASVSYYKSPGSCFCFQSCPVLLHPPQYCPIQLLIVHLVTLRLCMTPKPTG